MANQYVVTMNNAIFSNRVDPDNARLIFDLIKDKEWLLSDSDMDIDASAAEKETIIEGVASKLARSTYNQFGEWIDLMVDIVKTKGGLSAQQWGSACLNMLNSNTIPETCAEELKKWYALAPVGAWDRYGNKILDKIYARHHWNAVLGVLENGVDPDKSSAGVVLRNEYVENKVKLLAAAPSAWIAQMLVDFGADPEQNFQKKKQGGGTEDVNVLDIMTRRNDNSWESLDSRKETMKKIQELIEKSSINKTPEKIIEDGKNRIWAAIKNSKSWSDFYKVLKIDEKNLDKIRGENGENILQIVALKRFEFVAPLMRSAMSNKDWWKEKDNDGSNFLNYLCAGNCFNDSYGESRISREKLSKHMDEMLPLVPALASDWGEFHKKTWILKSKYFEDLNKMDWFASILDMSESGSSKPLVKDMTEQEKWRIGLSSRKGFNTVSKEVLDLLLKTSNLFPRCDAGPIWASQNSLNMKTLLNSNSEVLNEDAISVCAVLSFAQLLAVQHEKSGQQFDDEIELIKILIKEGLTQEKSEYLMKNVGFLIDVRRNRGEQYMEKIDHELQREFLKKEINSKSGVEKKNRSL